MNYFPNGNPNLYLITVEADGGDMRVDERPVVGWDPRGEPVTAFSPLSESSGLYAIAVLNLKDGKCFGHGRFWPDRDSCVEFLTSIARKRAEELESAELAKAQRAAARAAKRRDALEAEIAERLAAAKA